MRNVDFPGCVDIGKPRDMTDEQCSPVRAQFAVDEDGFAGYTMAYVPNKEDLEAMNAGLPLYVRILGNRLTPHAIYTLDAEGNGNY